MPRGEGEKGWNANGQEGAGEKRGRERETERKRGGKERDYDGLVDPAAIILYQYAAPVRFRAACTSRRDHPEDAHHEETSVLQSGLHFSRFQKREKNLLPFRGDHQCNPVQPVPQLLPRLLCRVLSFFAVRDHANRGPRRQDAAGRDSGSAAPVKGAVREFVSFRGSSREFQVGTTNFFIHIYIYTHTVTARPSSQSAQVLQKKDSFGDLLRRRDVSGF